MRNPKAKIERCERVREKTGGLGGVEDNTVGVPIESKAAGSDNVAVGTPNVVVDDGHSPHDVVQAENSDFQFIDGLDVAVLVVVTEKRVGPP